MSMHRVLLGVQAGWHHGPHSFSLSTKTGPIIWSLTTSGTMQDLTFKKKVCCKWPLDYSHWQGSVNTLLFIIDKHWWHGNTWTTSFEASQFLPGRNPLLECKEARPAVSTLTDSCTPKSYATIVPWPPTLMYMSSCLFSKFMVCFSMFSWFLIISTLLLLSWRAIVFVLTICSLVYCFLTFLSTRYSCRLALSAFPSRMQTLKRVFYILYFDCTIYFTYSLLYCSSLSEKSKSPKSLLKLLFPQRFISHNFNTWRQNQPRLLIMHLLALHVNSHRASRLIGPIRPQKKW